MNSRLALNLGAAAAALGAVLVSSAHPALAAPQFVHVTNGKGASDCMNGAVCLYADSDFNSSGNNRIVQMDEYVDWLGNYAFNDQASSVCNKTNDVAILYQDRNYEGDEYAIALGQCRNIPAWFNDEVSSVKAGEHR